MKNTKIDFQYTCLITELHKYLDLDLLNKIIDDSERIAEKEYASQQTWKMKNGK